MAAGLHQGSRSRTRIRSVVRVEIIETKCDLLPVADGLDHLYLLEVTGAQKIGLAQEAGAKRTESNPKDPLHHPLGSQRFLSRWWRRNTSRWLGRKLDGHPPRLWKSR